MGQSHRLQEVDALRGLAALAVLLFHYTTRYEQLYHHTQPLAWSVPWGHYGVNLFFVISGFVIYMTLHRTQHPMDFIVSRFSRLYPAYWCSIVVTTLVVALLGLPNREYSLATTLANFLMFHGLLGVAHVDGVYWTLEIELLFYCGALLLYGVGWLQRIHWVIYGLLLLRLTYHLADIWYGLDLPWIVSHLLILEHLPWFTCGIALYRLSKQEGAQKQNISLIICAILSLSIEGKLLLPLLAICFSIVIWLVCQGHLTILRNRLLVWLGTISYTLYLLHENIGWALLRHMEPHIPPFVAIILASCSTVVLASLVTLYVEQPAMRWIRSRYRNMTVEPQIASN